MTYATRHALRMALEQRLLTESRTTGVALDRLRRRVVFERIIARLQSSEPGQWVLKGGMALEVRLRDKARLTKDIDLGVRDEIADAEALRERVIEALTEDRDGDGFVLTPTSVTRLTEDAGGQPTWRMKVTAALAGRPFGGIQVDVSPRSHELNATDIVPLPNSLAFAGIAASTVEIIDVNRHVAEKFHGMLKDFGPRENSRVRDLVDIVILAEHRLIAWSAVAMAIRDVWRERDDADPPPTLPRLPETWPDRYEQLALDSAAETTSFAGAVTLISSLWAEMFAPGS